MFTDRATELRELHELLEGGKQVAIGAAGKAVTGKTVAATGMGGIGKTELAWQYVQAHREDDPGGVWWLTVRGGELVSQIIGYAVRMGLGQPPDEVASEQAKAQWCFDRWLQTKQIQGQRLLVLDDVVQYSDVKGLLPTDGRFRVLLTTRRKFDKPVRRLELGVLSEAEALELLLKLWRPPSPGPLPPSLGEGGLYISMGRYGEAEPLYVRSLHIREAQLGPEHPDTAGTYNNLARLYYHTDRYRQAEPLLIQVIESFHKALGQEHPNTQLVLKNFNFFLQQVNQADRTHELSDHPLTQQLLQQIQSEQTQTPENP